MLPKALGVVERAWNAYSDWPSNETFTTDFDRFYSIVNAKEKPLWVQKGYVFKKR
jgi:hypothetical protein